MLSQTVGYAIIALGHLAKTPGEARLVKEISEATNIPHAYLAKIVNMLAKKRFVSTQRGIGGGVALARDPKTITLYELCAAMDDPLVQKRCMMGTDECSDERACPAHKFWVTHRDRQIDFLKMMSVEDVADFEKRLEAEGKQPTSGELLPHPSVEI